MFFKDFVSVKRKKIKKGASQTYDTPSSTSHLGLLPSGKKRKPLLLVARNHFILWMADHQRSRQQQSCVLRYATAWTKENEMAAESPQQHALKSIAARPEAQKPTAARPEGAEALSPGQRPGF